MFKKGSQKRKKERKNNSYLYIIFHKNNPFLTIVVVTLRDFCKEPVYQLRGRKL